MAASHRARLTINGALKLTIGLGLTALFMLLFVACSATVSTSLPEPSPLPTPEPTLTTARYCARIPCPPGFDYANHRHREMEKIARLAAHQRGSCEMTRREMQTYSRSDYGIGTQTLAAQQGITKWTSDEWSTMGEWQLFHCDRYGY